MNIRKLHRALALFFSPFLITAAVTGLIWAYAPYLYLKEAAKPRQPITQKEEMSVRTSPLEAMQKVRPLEQGKIMGVTLRPENQKMIYAVAVNSKQGFKEILVDAENGDVIGPAPKKYPEFHNWIMKIHRLEFFGTKKELVVFPGLGLLLMLFTGLSLFKRGIK